MADDGPMPMVFFAATLNVYAVPFVRPVTVYEVAVDPVSFAVWAVVPMYGVTR
jgi:hypothetical protein